MGHAELRRSSIRLVGVAPTRSLEHPGYSRRGVSTHLQTEARAKLARSPRPELHRVLLVTKQVRHSLRFEGKFSLCSGGVHPRLRSPVDMRLNSAGFNRTGLAQAGVNPAATLGRPAATPRGVGVARRSAPTGDTEIGGVAPHASWHHELSRPGRRAGPDRRPMNRGGRIRTYDLCVPSAALRLD